MQVVLHLRDQLVQQLVARLVVQVHELVVCRAQRLVGVLLVLVALCVLRLRVAHVQAVQVHVQVVQAVDLLSVAVVLVVQAVRVLEQEHVRVVLVLVVLVVQAVVVRVVQVAVNAVLLERNHVLVVVKTSTKCCRKLQPVIQQAMHQFQRASSSLSAAHLRKSLLPN